MTNQSEEQERINKFMEKFSEWPHKKNGVMPIPPTPEVLGFMQHLNIKNARAAA